MCRDLNSTDLTQMGKKTDAIYRACRSCRKKKRILLCMYAALPHLENMSYCSRSYPGIPLWTEI